jgi:hypothetical protein
MKTQQNPRAGGATGASPERGSTESTSAERTPVGPFAKSMSEYFSEGLLSPLPLPPRQKASPPTGYTGQGGVMASSAELNQWRRERPNANIALRLPRNVLGIDVDDYPGKDGGSTLAAAEKAWGKLPPTIRSSARSDRPASGIRLFRIPEGLAWPSKLPQGGGVDEIRWDHR